MIEVIIAPLVDAVAGIFGMLLSASMEPFRYLLSFKYRSEVHKRLSERKCAFRIFYFFWNFTLLGIVICIAVYLLVLSADADTQSNDASEKIIENELKKMTMNIIKNMKDP